MGWSAASFKGATMRFKFATFSTLALVLSCMGSLGHAQSGITDFIKSTKNPSAAAKQAGGAASNDASVKTSAINAKDSDIPEWLRDSARLEKMLGSDANYRVENPKVVRRIEAPIPGLDGFVVEGTSFSDASPDGKKELYVFYTDKSRRYLMVGMMIDMQKDRDMNLDIERFVRGEMADNPARALRPQDMHAITIPGKGKTDPLTFVVDLGPQAGKDSFLNLMRLHKSLMTSGANARALRIVLVSAGHDEFGTVAMAMAYGSEATSGDGIGKLIEYAEKGKAVSWLGSKRMNKDSNIKRVLGTGIFKMEDNSTQALLARLDTLPLIYEGDGQRMKNIPLPTNAVDWRALLLKK